MVTDYFYGIADREQQMINHFNLSGAIFCGFIVIRRLKFMDLDFCKTGLPLEFVN